MRVILQRSSSTLYFCRGDMWTPHFKQAHDFGTLEKAVEFTVHQHLEDVQAVLIKERTTGGVDFMPYSIQRLLREVNPPAHGAPRVT